MLGLAGCKGGAAADDAGEKASGKGLVIGWSQRGISGSDWWKTLVEGGQAEADKIGASIELLDANGDTVRQNADVQTLITKGVDVVVMNPNDPSASDPRSQALKDAGIPVVTVNSTSTSPWSRTCSATSRRTRAHRLTRRRNRCSEGDREVR